MTDNVVQIHQHDFVSVMAGAGVDIRECRADRCAMRSVELAADYGVNNVTVFTLLVEARGMTPRRFLAIAWRSLFGGKR